MELLNFVDVVLDAAEEVWNTTLLDDLIIKLEAIVLGEVDGCCLPADLAAGGEQAGQGGVCLAMHARADSAGVRLHLDGDEAIVVVDEAESVDLVTDFTWESVESADVGCWAIVHEVLDWPRLGCSLCSASAVPILVVQVGWWRTIGLALPIDT